MTTKTERYFHINNGGVSFVVEDTPKGPQVTVSAHHFVHNTARTSIRVPKEALKELADLFTEAYAKEYSPDDSWAVELPRRSATASASDASPIPSAQ